MGGYDPILFKYDLFFDVSSSRNMKNQALQNSTLHKILENGEFTNKKHGKTTLYSLIVNHVLETSVKFQFLCVCFRKETLFWWFRIGFLFVFIKLCSHDATCIIEFFSTIMLKPKK